MRAPLLLCEMRSGLMAASETDQAWLDNVRAAAVRGVARAPVGPHLAAGLSR